jgi:1-acyl-sn-glycerol-3-phosphate acyltransferase
MNSLRILIYAVTVVLIMLWSSLCVIFASLLLLVSFNRKSAFWAARRIWAPGVLRIARIQLEVEGKEYLDPSRPVVFIMNHQSFLDVPAAFASLQSDLHFIAKKELKYVPFIGWYMQMVGMIFVDRKKGSHAISSMRKAGRLVRTGRTVLAFPEGTRSHTGKIGPFKKGIFFTAIEAKVPMIPVIVDGAINLMPSGSFLVRPGKIRILIGKPIDLSQASLDQRVEIMELSRSRLIELQNQLLRREGPYEGITKDKPTHSFC